MSNEDLRNHLVDLLKSKDAHVDFETTIANFPIDEINTRIPNIPYTPYQVVEHMRLAQWDILEFSRNPNYIPLKFPEGYWPGKEFTANENDWNKSLEAFREDLQQLINLVKDESTDLFTPIPHGSGQTILREILLTADHNAYHLGQLVLMRRSLGVWKN
ncbi:DinB family protein [candidate division KSB1 bacterium]|nr:DinB family protein [candidate division KSB1 bacterium]